MPLVAIRALVLGAAITAAPGVPHGQTLPASVDDLRRQLQERDAIIADLLRRVEALERRAAGIEPGAGRPEEDAGPSAPPADAAPASAQSAQAEAAPPAETPSPPAAPGQLEVDERAAERALERTLVQTGALLLPFGQAEIEPGFSFTRREDDAPASVLVDGIPTTAEVEQRRNAYEARLDLRIGLPLDAQLELGLPYRWVDAERVVRAASIPPEKAHATGSGLGDPSVGLAKTLLREQGWWPDLIARFTWDGALGQTSDDGVALGGGLHELLGSLTVVKRQDPLVFVGSVSYEAALEEEDFDPGDALGFRLGAVLAASPETSLRFFLDQRFVDEAEIGGQTIDGSDLTLATLEIGASSILGRGLLLDIAVGAGLTEDAADYSVAISLPFRFDLPVGIGGF